MDRAKSVEAVIIVGAGGRGKELLTYMKAERDIYVAAFFDNATELIGSNIEGVKVCLPYCFDERALYIIAVESSIVRTELVSQLDELGVASEDIMIYYPVRNYEYRSQLEEKYYPDEIQEMYEECFGKKMDWDTPKTYNEILNWEKVNLKDERRTLYADKYLVREFVKEKIGEEHLTKWYGVWDDANDIDFDSLPDRFVLKTNNGSDRNIIVTDKSKLDIEKVKKQLNEWRDSNYAYMVFELHYKDIVPKIICEEYLEGVAESIYDYNIYCFHGEPEYIWCIKGSHRPGCQATFYDKEWTRQPFSYGYPEDKEVAPRPEMLDEMLEYSRILSREFSHVRVDWYNLPDGRVLFCEMTFVTWGGLKKFVPEEYDMLWGERINRR